MIGEVIAAVFSGILFIGLPVAVFLNGHKKEGIAAGLVLVPSYLIGLSLFFFPSISLLWIMSGVVLFGTLLCMIVSKNMALIWACSILFIGGIAVIYGSLIKGDEWFVFRWPWWPIPIGIWLLAGFCLGIIRWAKGRGGTGAEKEEVVKHHKPSTVIPFTEVYAGKSVRRGDTTKHYDADGRYRGKSELQRK
jgi:hypothetical protein